MPSIKAYTLGCKVNSYETEAVLQMFLENGFTEKEIHETADVTLINTCAVTQMAGNKSLKYVKHFVKENENSFVIVMGCFSQLEPFKILTAGAKIVIGTNFRRELFSIYKDYKEPIIKTNEILKENKYENLKISSFSKTRAFVKIADGCNEFCSFCVIPFVRGHLRSRDPEDIINEIKSLRETGVNEIVLTGINTAAYGKDLKTIDFPDLLEKIITNVKNCPKIRISSMEVVELNDKLLMVLKRFAGHFCQHFHLPIQSGSDSVLKSMRRPYDLDYFRDRVKRLREIFPTVNITTDILAGYLTETDEEFTNSLNFLKEIGFGELHVFPYSKRQYTKDYTKEEKITPEVKHRRVQKLLTLNKELSLNYRKSFLDKELKVLVEKVIKGVAFGHTDNYLEVKFNYDGKTNKYVNVKITKPKYPVSEGEFISSN